MNINIATLTISELESDLFDSQEDIKLCEMSLRKGISYYSGGSVQDRLDSNKHFVKVITAEIERRKSREREKQAGDKLDSYLLSLKFSDGQPSSEKTTFIKVVRQCGAEYATRVSLFDHEPVSLKSVLESKATCPVCKRALVDASVAAMYMSGGGAVISITSMREQMKHEKEKQVL